ncbi:MAG: TRAP transporter substrate-binding protein [Eubacterium sp.]|nr:TRAP transporter substrate-binding protein [Eubacterium sp.]
MKKRLLCLAAIMILILSGCGETTEKSVKPAVSGSSASIESNNKSEEISYPITIRVGYSTGETDPRGIALAKFKESVEQRTNKDIRIEIHPGGELGSDGELIAGLITDDVDMTVSSAGNFALYATRMGVSALPFLFDDFESAWKFIDSDEIQALGKDLEEYNMHVLSYFDNGFRCVTTSEKIGPVEKASDMDGLNIRTPDNQIVMETMSELGANPRSYPFAELTDALKKGVFDAQENPIPVIYNNGLYKVQKYLSITNHIYDAMPLVIRNNLWNGIKGEYKSIIEDEAKKAQDENRNLVKKQTSEYVSKLEDVGMKVNRPDLEPFRNATSGVAEVFENVFGEDLLNFVAGK